MNNDIIDLASYSMGVFREGNSVVGTRVQLVLFQLISGTMNERVLDKWNNEILAGRKSSRCNDILEEIKEIILRSILSQINSIIFEVMCIFVCVSIYYFKIIENIFLSNSEDLVAWTI